MNFDEMIEYVQNQFHSCPQHRQKYIYREKFSHTLRVLKWAKILLKTETADMDILLTAVIFHDVGYTVSPKDHMLYSADICRNYLSGRHYDPEFIEKVCEIIRNHDDKQLLHKQDTSMEQILMIEADNLDESGAVSILWDVLGTGQEEDASYQKAYERILAHPVSNEKMELFSATSTARKIWQQKQMEYERFTDALKRDLE